MSTGPTDARRPDHNGRRRAKRQPEADVGNRERIEEQQRRTGQPNRVTRRRAMIERPHSQIHARHQRGARDRGAARRYRGVDDQQQPSWPAARAVR